MGFAFVLKGEEFIVNLLVESLKYKAWNCCKWHYKVQTQGMYYAFTIIIVVSFFVCSDIIHGRIVFLSLKSENCLGSLIFILWLFQQNLHL